MLFRDVERLHEEEYPSLAKEMQSYYRGRNAYYVIACEDEIDALFHLYRWGVEKVYVYTGKP